MSVKNNTFDEAGEIEKYHRLLKEGIITEEEFNAKKAEILSRDYSKMQTPSTTGEMVKRTILDKKVLYPLLAFIVLIIGFLVWNNTLFGNDKMAYDLMLKAAKKFNYPSTVRIESGTVVDDSMFANISAENGFGKRSTDCYWISSDGYVLEDTTSACLGSNFQKPLNTKKINKKLKAYFKED